MSRIDDIERRLASLENEVRYELDTFATSREGYVPISVVIDVVREVDLILRSQVGVGLDVPSLRARMRPRQPSPAQPPLAAAPPAASAAPHPTEKTP